MRKKTKEGSLLIVGGDFKTIDADLMLVGPDGRGGGVKGLGGRKDFSSPFFHLCEIFILFYFDYTLHVLLKVEI